MSKLTPLRLPIRVRSVSTLVLALLTAAGALLRLRVAHQSLFGDELSTFWIVKGKELVRVLSIVYGDSELSPPTFFVASWLTTKLGDAPEFLRLPSLIAGIATIPLVYLIGLRLVGRATGIVAAALAAFSPFMIYYSAEARAYALMIAMVAVSTVTMLIAADTGRVRWWVVYAIATCAAVWTHYTCVFVLAAQLLWVLWAHPEARRAASRATLAAAVGFLPWMPGLVHDFRSSTMPIVFRLQAFTPHDVRLTLEHWSIGYPYVLDRGAIELPGTFALGLLAIGLLLALTGLATGIVRPRRFSTTDPHLRRPVLVVLLAIAGPAGAAMFSAIGMHIFSARDLAASWPGFALSVAMLLCAAGPRLRYVAAALVVAGFAIGGAKMLTVRYQRPDYRMAAEYIDRQALPGDVVIDPTAVVSPGPLSGMDVAFRRQHRVFRAGAPQERDHSFGLLDPRNTFKDAVDQAVAAAGGGRIFVIAHGPLEETLGHDDRPVAYRLIEPRSYPGILPLFVGAYAPYPAAAQ